MKIKSFISKQLTPKEKIDNEWWYEYKKVMNIDTRKKLESSLREKGYRTKARPIHLRLVKGATLRAKDNWLIYTKPIVKTKKGKILFAKPY